MKAYIVPAGAKSAADLRLIERADPHPAPGQVLVRVRAASLNYRDQAIAAGTYMGSGGRDIIPLSDGAGAIAWPPRFFRRRPKVRPSRQRERWARRWMGCLQNKSSFMKTASCGFHNVSPSRKVRACRVRQSQPGAH